MDRVERLAPVIVVVAAVLAGVHAIDPSPVGVFYDDAHYVILGRALALGEGYRYINVPGAPAATHFPPGYPALLAILWRLSPSFPENIALFKMVNAALLGVVGLAVYWLARRLFAMTPVVASLAALASTIAIPALLLSSNVISEILFLSVLLPFLVVAEESCGRVGGGLRRAALLGIWVGLMCLIRSHAIVLLPAIAIAYAIQRRYREAAVAVAAGILVMLPWLVWVRHYDPLVPLPVRGQYGSYGAWLAEGLRANGLGLLAEALRQNVATSVAIIARSFSLARNVVLDSAAVLAVATLCVAGAVDFAKRARVALVFIILYLVIVLLWPFSPLRFLWGIWPLLVVLMIAGARYLWRPPVSGRAAKIWRTVAMGAGAIALAGALSFNVRGYANAWWATVSRSFSPRIQPQLVWVTEKTRRTDVIVADDEGAVYLYTGRRAVPASAFTAEQYFRGRSAEENAGRMLDIIRAFSPTYVVAWAKPTLDAATILSAARPPLLVQMDTIPTGRVFRRAD